MAVKIKDTSPADKKPDLPPKLFIAVPTSKFPMGVVPAFTRVYILITLPLYSSEVFS